jgi:hypothetical protein
MDTKVTDIRIATIYKDEQGIVIITMKNCGVVDEYDVMDLNLVIRHQANGQPVLKLLNALADFELTKKAKEMAEKEDNISQTKARAIVVSGGMKASIMNFLKQFSEKGYPQQFFSNQEEAYNWLLSFRNDHSRDLHF